MRDTDLACNVWHSSCSPIQSTGFRVNPDVWINTPLLLLHHHHPPPLQYNTTCLRLPLIRVRSVEITKILWISLSSHKNARHCSPSYREYTCSFDLTQFLSFSLTIHNERTSSNELVKVGCVLCIRTLPLRFPGLLTFVSVIPARDCSENILLLSFAWSCTSYNLKEK